MIDIHKFRHWVLMAFLFVCPIIYNNTNNMDLRDFQERAFQIGAMVVFAFFVGNLWIGAFLVLNVLSLLLNTPSIGLQQVLNVFLGCVLFSVSHSYFKKNESTPYLKILLWVGALNLFWMILQMNGIDPLYIAQDASGIPQLTATYKDASGLFGIKMANAIFICLLMPILASINLWIVPLLLVPLYYTRSSVACISILISMGFYIYHIHRKLFIWFIGISLVGGLAYAIYDFKDDPSTFKSRFPLWHAVTKYSLIRPILGYGPDSFRNYTKQKDFLFYSDYDYNTALLTQRDEKTAYFKYYEMDNGKMHDKNDRKSFDKLTLNWWDNPHNEYFQMLFEYGFLGLFILGGFIRELTLRFKFAIKSKELIVLSSCLLVYAISGIGHFPIHLARLAFLFPILLGAFIAKTDNTYEVQSA
mgnify:CR=1 FL=1